MLKLAQSCACFCQLHFSVSKKLDNIKQLKHMPMILGIDQLAILISILIHHINEKIHN